MTISKLARMAKAVCLALAASALVLTGCQTSHRHQASPQASPTAAVDAAQKGGSQLWAENCVRCHNVRTPSSYSDAEWEVAMHHMRIRANLTAGEHKKILEFLKSAN